MRRFLVLLGALLAVSMPMLAIFAASEAVPEMVRTVGSGTIEVRWIHNAYLVAFTSLLLLGGALGDRFGRKSMLVWGLVIFAASSAAGGLAATSEQLVAARAAMGLGAALVVPATLAVLAAAFSNKGRGVALGLWAAVSTGAAAYGPLAGAYVVPEHSWEWLFFANVAVGVVALVLVAAGKESRDLSPRRFDLAGTIIGTLGLGALAFALAEGTIRGWTDELVAGALVLSAVLLTVFLLVETRRAQPVVSLRHAGHATFSASNAVAAAVFFSLFGIAVFVTAYLRNVVGQDPGTAALHLLPFAGALLVVCPIAGAISDRLGSRSLMTYGCILAAGGLGLILQADLQPAYGTVILPALVLMGVGLSLAAGPMTTAVTGVVDPGQLAGAAGATGTARKLGLLVGIALMATVVRTAFKNSFLNGLLEAGIDQPAAEGIAENPSVLSVLTGAGFDGVRGQMPPGSSPELLESGVRAAQEAFIDALHTGALLSIGFLLLAAMISLIFVRSHVISLFRVEAEPGRRERDEVRDSSEEPEKASADPSPTPHIPVMPPAENGDTQGPGEAVAGRPDSVDEPVRPDEPEPLEEQTEPADDDRPAEVVLLSHPERTAGPADLTTVLFQFPFKAGTGTVVDNVTEFVRTTMDLQERSGSHPPPAVALPESVAGGLDATTSADIATLTGYLLLEQRFGRIKPETKPELAATALMGAAKSIKMWNFSDGSTDAGGFLDGLVKVVMDGIGPVENPGDDSPAKRSTLSA